MKKIFFKGQSKRLHEGDDFIHSNSERVTKKNSKKFQTRNSIKIEQLVEIMDEIIKNHLNKMEKYEGRNRKNLLELQKSKAISPKLILGIIFFIIFSKINLIPIDDRILNYDSTITIKIQKSGTSKLYSNERDTDFCGAGPNLPKEIIINTNEQHYITDLPNEYDFPNEGNTIQLIYDDPIESCRCLFLNCNNITEIDLT